MAWPTLHVGLKFCIIHVVNNVFDDYHSIFTLLRSDNCSYLIVWRDHWAERNLEKDYCLCIDWCCDNFNMKTYLNQVTLIMTSVQIGRWSKCHFLQLNSLFHNYIHGSKPNFYKKWPFGTSFNWKMVAMKKIFGCTPLPHKQKERKTSS